IKETTNLVHVSIRNGGITLNTPYLGGADRYTAIDLLTSTYSVIEDLSVTNADANSGHAMKTGQLSLYRHVRFKGGAPLSVCPTLIVESIGIIPEPPACVHANSF